MASAFSSPLCATFSPLVFPWVSSLTCILFQPQTSLLSTRIQPFSPHPSPRDATYTWDLQDASLSPATLQYEDFPLANSIWCFPTELFKHVWNAEWTRFRIGKVIHLKEEQNLTSEGNAWGSQVRWFICEMCVSVFCVCLHSWGHLATA